MSIGWRSSRYIFFVPQLWTPISWDAVIRLPCSQPCSKALISDYLGEKRVFEYDYWVRRYQRSKLEYEILECIFYLAILATRICMLYIYDCTFFCIQRVEGTLRSSNQYAYFLQSRSGYYWVSGQAYIISISHPPQECLFLYVYLGLPWFRMLFLEAQVSTCIYASRNLGQVL